MNCPQLMVMTLTCPSVLGLGRDLLLYTEWARRACLSGKNSQGRASEGPACQVRWGHPTSYCGYDKRAPSQEARRDLLVRSVFWDLGGTCLSGPHRGKVQLPRLFGGLVEKSRKNCSTKGKNIHFSAHPAGNPCSGPFASPVMHAI